MVMSRSFILFFSLAAYEASGFFQIPQNPSPMQDDTREHKRIPETVVPGRRVALSPEKNLLLPQGGQQQSRGVLVIHFHGPSWVPEATARQKFPGSAVLTVQAMGAGSDAYRELLAPSAERFNALLGEAEQASHAKFKTVILSAFSAGYGAVREILRDHENWKRVDGVVLADSMHAEYGGESRDLGPFLDFAREALSGHKRFLISHSEVFPGTYSSTTETTSFLLKELGLRRQPVLEWGMLGMQQLSKAGKGGLQILGFAGNSAPDHMDHLFALEDWYDRVSPPPPAAAAARKKR